MEEFLRHYGLIAVYLGMLVEGETVMVIAGFLAHQHLFPVWAVYPVAVAGALSVDNLIFFLGRTSERRKMLKKLMVNEAGARPWADRMGDSWVVFFSVRFLYGTRTAFMFYTGRGGMSWRKFIVREVPSVLFWCAAWLFFGKLLSRVLLVLLGEMHAHIRLLVVIAIAAIGTGSLIFVAIRQRRGKRPEKGRPGGGLDLPHGENSKGQEPKP